MTTTLDIDDVIQACLEIGDLSKRRHFANLNGLWMDRNHRLIPAAELSNERLLKIFYGLVAYAEHFAKHGDDPVDRFIIHPFYGTLRRELLQRRLMERWMETEWFPVP